MSRRFSSLVPLAQPHPRKPSGLRQSIDSTPFAQPHPRNLDSPQRTRLPHPPRRIALCRISRPRPLFGLIPFAQLHPRKKTSGRGFIPSVNSRQTNSLPTCADSPAQASGVGCARNERRGVVCFPTACAGSPAQQAQRACALCSNVKNAGESRRYKNPLAQPHLRKPFLVTRHLSLITEFLIANLELEFGLTHTKLGTLEISLVRHGD